MACGAGLLLLALAVTLAYFVVAFVFPIVLRLLPTSHATEVEHD
jgi:putative Mg2+ transporter-C (MgtC) family protein